MQYKKLNEEQIFRTKLKLATVEDVHISEQVKRSKRCMRNGVITFFKMSTVLRAGKCSGICNYVFFTNEISLIKIGSLILIINYYELEKSWFLQIKLITSSYGRYMFQGEKIMEHISSLVPSHESCIYQKTSWKK